MTSLAFKPWARDTTEPTALKDVLARVNLERGHFRDITEASLQEEIAGQGALELSESEDEDENEDDDEDDEKEATAKPTTREELYKAKFEMLQHLEVAHNDVLLALDFVSLLLSKDAPPQAQQTVSPALKATVPLGTLGTDVWHKMPLDTAREAQDDLLATNVRLEGLQQSADSLLVAASRLEDNVRRETQYWDQILSITEKGWNVCKIPGQQHRLGVTFGFSESAAEFSRRGVAALNANEDGSIALDRGVGSKPKAVRVVLKRGGETVGSSTKVGLLDDGETTLEARIRRARDSLFDEELFHEMIRESRAQVSLGVSMRDNAICFSPEQGEGDAVEVRFELMSLDEIDNLSDGGEARQQDALAQAIAVAARMLLGQSHRERLRKRSEVPLPMSERKEEKSVLPILRPIMAFILHHAAIEQANSYVKTIASLLSAAKMESRCSPANLSLPDVANITSAELLTSTLMRPWISHLTISLEPAESQTAPILVTLETTLAGTFGTVYVLELPNQQQQQQSFRSAVYEEVRSALDAALASQLAGRLHTTMGEGWEWNRREALLTKAGGEDDRGGSIWVTVDGEEGVLCMSSPTKKLTWSIRSDGAEEAFSEAWRGVLA